MTERSVKRSLFLSFKNSFIINKFLPSYFFSYIKFHKFFSVCCFLFYDLFFLSRAA